MRSGWRWMPLVRVEITDFWAMVFNRSSMGWLGHALIGMPCVLSYTVAIYWTFRGKVSLDRNSY